MKAVRAAFETARLDSSGIDEAVAVTEHFLATAPGHPVVLAYQGALHAMKAGATTLPWIKMKHVNAAVALLEAAFERRFEAPAPAPDDGDPPFDLEILLVRGVAYANFPAFLGRIETARQCLEAARGHAAFGMVPCLYRALVHAHLAVLRHREREDASAVAHLEHARQADAPTADGVWAAR